ncbi:unnamed protein product, partial [marine sediment metagenome]
MKKIVVFSFLIGLGIILFSSGLAYPEQNSAPYIKLGLDYYHLKEYTKARQAFEQAVKLEPDNFEAHYNLALTELELKEYEEATEELMVCVKLKPAYP